MLISRHIDPMYVSMCIRFKIVPIEPEGRVPEGDATTRRIGLEGEIFLKLASRKLYHL